MIATSPLHTFSGGYKAIFLGLGKVFECVEVSDGASCGIALAHLS